MCRKISRKISKHPEGVPSRWKCSASRIRVPASQFPPLLSTDTCRELSRQRLSFSHSIPTEKEKEKEGNRERRGEALCKIRCNTGVSEDREIFSFLFRSRIKATRKYHFLRVAISSRPLLLSSKNEFRSRLYFEYISIYLFLTFFEFL